MADQPPPGREPRPWMTKAAQAIVTDFHLAPELVPKVAATILWVYECPRKREQRHRASERLELRALMKFFTTVPLSQSTGTRLTATYHLRRIESVRALLAELRNWQRNPGKIRIVEIPARTSRPPHRPGSLGYELWRV